jgi:hypothetical protein
MILRITFSCNINNKLKYKGKIIIRIKIKTKKTHKKQLKMIKNK